MKLLFKFFLAVLLLTVSFASWVACPAGTLLAYDTVHAPQGECATPQQLQQFRAEGASDKGGESEVGRQPKEGRQSEEGASDRGRGDYGSYESGSDRYRREEGQYGERDGGRYRDEGDGQYQDEAGGGDWGQPSNQGQQGDHG